MEWLASGAPGSAANPAPSRWHVACPDVFGAPHQCRGVPDPVVHEIKVSRADLLADLRRPEKRAAYLAMGGACW